MDYPAARRSVTPHIKASPLMCSEFRQGRRYTNWRPRGTADWLLIYTAAGAGIIRCRDTEVRLPAHQAILFEPTAPQEYFTDPRSGHWHLQWVHFVPRPQWRAWLVWPEIGRGTRHLSLSPAAAAVFSGSLGRMLTSSRLEGDSGMDLAMNALEEALLWAYREICDGTSRNVDSRVRRAAHILATDPSKPFSLPALAQQCGLSESRLSHLFKRDLQTTPQRFSEKLRLDLAEQLLAQTNLSVAEVARETGFNDPLYFSRRFRLMRGRKASSLRAHLNK